MTRVTNEYLDILCLILAICLGILNLPHLANYWGTNLVASRQEKTALDVNEAISVAGADLESEAYVNSYGNMITSGKELLMSLLVADEGAPTPSAVKIGDCPVVEIDAVWVSNKYSNIASMYVKKGVTRLVNATDWTVTSVNLEYNDSGETYWHFELAK